jgi:hypothetical protein
MTPVASAPVSQISTPGLAERYREAQSRAKTFNSKLDAIRRVEKEIDKADARSARWAKFGWLGGWVREKSAHWSDEAHGLDMKRVSLEAEAEAARLETQFDVGNEESSSWSSLVSAFEKLCEADRIWDVTAKGASEHHKSPASHSVDRKPVHFGIGSLPTIRPDVRALHMSNANGPDIWIYPSMLAVGDLRDSPALVDLREVKVEIAKQQFIEDENLPKDSQQVGYTWRYVNKGGGPDLRFAANPQLPVMLYGQIDITSSGGLRERFHVSDVSKAVDFVGFFKEHLSAVRWGQV